MLFNNIDISGKRLPNEDKKIYRKRRKLINDFLKLYLKNGNDRIQIYKKGFKQRVAPITEASLINKLRVYY